MFKGCVADCPVVADLFSMSQLRASFQYLGMPLHNLSETQMIQTESKNLIFINFPEFAINASINSSGAHPPPPPPGQPQGICSRCQSRGLGIHNFIVAPGAGH